jgi:hypothetical protein
MGYRSEVKAVFYTSKVDQWPMLRLFVDENFPKNFKDNLEVIGSSTYSGFVFICADVKWYGGYPDVQAFNKFVADYGELISGENAPPWAYEFIRIGEDYEDIETDREGDYDHVLQVTREITCDF